MTTNDSVPEAPQPTSASMSSACYFVHPAQAKSRVSTETFSTLVHAEFLEMALRRELSNSPSTSSLEISGHQSCTQRILQILWCLALCHRVAMLTPRTTEDATRNPRTCVVARPAWELSFGDMRLTERDIWQLFVLKFAKWSLP